MTFRKKNLQFGMVAFVDLLGFSEKVRALETVNDLKTLERQVRRVQGWFDHRPTDTYIKTEQKLVAKTVLAFSDSVVISIPVSSELVNVQGEFDVLMAELDGLATSQGRSVVNGIFLRGGVGLGLWYRRGATLISDALIDAYKLEGAACVPMIAITDELYNHLANHSDRTTYSIDRDPLGMFKRFNDLPNGQSSWMIDYLPICLGAVDGELTPEERERYKTATGDERDALRQQAYDRDRVNWARWHADEIRKAAASTQEDNVKSKYKWLARYHDNVVENSFLNPPGDIVIGDII